MLVVLVLIMVGVAAWGAGWGAVVRGLPTAAWAGMEVWSNLRFLGVSGLDIRSALSRIRRVNICVLEKLLCSCAAHCFLFYNFFFLIPEFLLSDDSCFPKVSIGFPGLRI
ncbi:uncharacterized protein P884DRAFT_261893 [Thermothelomyces heterothallicus CBS 202.75]|uniref:uncharacterized protein n=1 Tax=Thermothelomyces heterothallicus CBS 202.75 TaxID=1149848 RepID=UPI0037433305